MHARMKKPKLRYILLAVFLVVLFAGTALYINSVSHSYVVQMTCGGDKPAIDKITVNISDESVVKLTNTEVIYDEKMGYSVYFTFESLRSGLSYFDANYPVSEDYGHGAYAQLLVTPWGMIFDGGLSDFTGSEALFPMLLLSFAAVALVLLLTFFEKRRKGDFSYSMVACGGAALFLLGCIAVFLNHYISNGGYEAMQYFHQLIFLLVSCGGTFVNVAFPLLVILSAAVSISNIQLVRREGFRPVNLLGIITGTTVIVLFIALHIMSANNIGGSETEAKIYDSIEAAWQYIFCYFECMLTSVIICSVMATRYKLPYEQDYLIILGCAIRKDGTPTPILRGRIDRAVAFEREQFAATGKHAKFVPSGGQGGDEVIAEAESMKRYLMEQGYPEEQILPEDKSVNTYQNMAFSKRVIEEDAGSLSGVKVAFSTTNYHVFRGYILSKKINMPAHGLSAKTKLYFFPNAFVREFIGLLFEEKLAHIIVVSAILLFYIGLIVLFGI